MPENGSVARTLDRVFKWATALLTILVIPLAIFGMNLRERVGLIEQKVESLPPSDYRALMDERHEMYMRQFAAIKTTTARILALILQD